MKPFFKAFFMVAIFFLAVAISGALYCVVGHFFGLKGEIILGSLALIWVFIYYYTEEKNKNDGM